MQVNSLCCCWEPRLSISQYNREIKAPGFASCCSYGTFLFATKIVLVLSGNYDQMQNYCRFSWHRELFEELASLPLH